MSCVRCESNFVSWKEAVKCQPFILITVAFLSNHEKRGGHSCQTENKMKDRLKETDYMSLKHEEMFWQEEQSYKGMKLKEGTGNRKE